MSSQTTAATAPSRRPANDHPTPDGGSRPLNAGYAAPDDPTTPTTGGAALRPRYHENHSGQASAASWGASELHRNVFANHARRKARAWGHQRAIREAAWAGGQPWLHEGNCAPIPQRPVPPAPGRRFAGFHSEGRPVPMPAKAETLLAHGAPGQFATVEERRRAQSAWAERDRQLRRVGKPEAA